jgi:hypothetical protein
METTHVQLRPASRGAIWTGRILVGLVSLMFLVFGSYAAIMPSKVVDSMTQLGYPANVARPIGIVQALIGVLLLIPRTAVFGGLLITAYLGGATATHVRAGQPFFLPVIVGIVVWIGLLLRERRLRALLPLRQI